MKKIAHAFVIPDDPPGNLKPFFDTLEIFYRRFNPDKELGYISLQDYPSTPILHNDPDEILGMFADGHEHIKVDYDYVVLHWQGSTFRGHTTVTVKYHEYLNNETEDFLVMGHIMDAEKHRPNRGDYYFMFPITLVINLKVYRKLGKPKLGIGSIKKHLWIAERSDENVHDHYTPRKLMPGTGTKEVETTNIGWNIIHESLKNEYPVLNLPMDLRCEKIFTYPDDGPEKFAEAIDAVWNISIPNNDNQRKWLLEQVQRKLSPDVGHTVFLFNTEHYVFWEEAYNELIHDNITFFIGPASGFKDFVLCYKKFEKQKNEIRFYHFDQSEYTLKLKEHILKWNGDRHKFFNHIKEYEHYDKIKEHIWPDEENWNKYLDDLYAQFSSPEEFMNRWWQYTNRLKNDEEGYGGCVHKFIHLNVINEPGSLFNYMPKNNRTSGIVWLSDIFLGTNEITHGRENLKNKLEALITRLADEKPAVLLDYKDTNDTPIFNRVSEIYTRQLVNKNQSFCVLPFMHMQYKPNGQPKPCCRFDLESPEYNQLHELGDFWGANTIFLRDLVSQNSGAVTLEKYPGIHPGALAKMSDIGHASMEDAFNSDFWNDVRTKMLKGEKIPGCKKCYEEEDGRFKQDVVKPELGFGFSMRAGMNFDWNDGKFDRLSDKKEIKFIELGFGNYCNLACRMCSSNLSTTWYDDDKALAGKYNRVLTPRIEDADIKIADETLLGLKEIKFTGGEPMVHPNFAKLINRIVKLGCAKNIKLEIFTNCSYSPSNKITKDLTQFKQVNLSLSIDGYGKVNDYIRYPSQWSKVEAAARKWLTVEHEQDNFMIQMNPTITLYNIMYLEELYNWWYKLKLETGTGVYELMYSTNTNDQNRAKETLGQRRVLVMNTANWPDYLAVLLLPPWLKDKLIEKYSHASNHTYSKELWSDWGMDDMKYTRVPLDLQQSLNRVLVQIKRNSYTDASLKEFYSYTKDLDKLRNQTFETTLPELWEEIKGSV